MRSRAHGGWIEPVSIKDRDFSYLAWLGDSVHGIIDLGQPFGQFMAQFREKGIEPPPWHPVSAGRTYRKTERFPVTGDTYWHTRRALLNADGDIIGSVTLYDGPSGEL